jgi:hypothetical protein
MQPDALSQLGKAIEAAAEAAVVPLLLLAALAVVVSLVPATRSRLREPGQRAPRGDPAEPGSRAGRGAPLRYFVQSAEAAAYPALLFVSLLALAIALSGFFVVAATDAAWTVGLAIGCELLALAMLMAAIYAAMSDAEPAEDREAASLRPMPQEASPSLEQPVEGARRPGERRAA